MTGSSSSERFSSTLPTSILPRVAPATRRIAIIDIGSNSIRLVVYDGHARTPIALFNEKSVCALGEELEMTGRLNRAGVVSALNALARFVRLAKIMHVDTLDILATAAVRDASDGADFVRAVKQRCDVDVTVLSGEQEAKLAATGVLCSSPEADGIVADLGGGSLELVALDHGHFVGHFVTMPLGVLRLSDASNGDRARGAAVINRHLSAVDWLGWGKNRALYAVGGAWRALARVCIAQTGHPLHVLDNYSLECGEALRQIELIGRQGRKAMEKVPGLSKKRLQHLPVAAQLLEKLLVNIRPSRLIFSVYGMREGRFFSHLPAEMQWQDPLISSCIEMARTVGRFPEHGEEVLEWMSPLFTRETPQQGRLRYAACLLSDVFWNEHPDYRAEQAFLRVFRLPFMGLGHQDRAALALAIYTRYQNDTEVPAATAACDLLSDDEQRRARLIGLALRLGHGISGGAPGLLRTTRLLPERDVLVLSLPRNEPAFGPDLLDRRYERLAKLAGFDHLELRWE